MSTSYVSQKQLIIRFFSLFLIRCLIPIETFIKKFITKFYCFRYKKCQTLQNNTDAVRIIEVVLFKCLKKIKGDLFYI